MRNFRCMLLCLSLLTAVSLMVGCSCGKPQDETSASTSAETSSAGMNETQTQESTTWESSSSPGDIYETGNGYQDSTGGIEDGGLMGDVTDGLEQMGEDISDAVDDVTDGARTRSR